MSSSNSQTSTGCILKPRWLKWKCANDSQNINSLTTLKDSGDCDWG